MDDNNNLTPVQGEEEKDFSVTENNSWDAHQAGYRPAQQNTPAPQQGAPVMQQATPIQPQQGAPMQPQQGAPMQPQPGAPIPPQGPGPVPPKAPMPYRGAVPQPGLVPELSIKHWLLTLFLADIPIAGLILRLIWGLDGTPTPENRAKKNWAIASLIWLIIKYVIGTILTYTFFYTLVGILDYFF